MERELRTMRAGGPGPNLTRQYKGPRGKVSWHAVGNEQLDVGALDLAQLFQTPSAKAEALGPAEVYLYRRIECDQALELEVCMGSDDGLRFWCNAEQLVDAQMARALNPADHALVLSLQPGANHLLARVVNTGGAWSFRMSEPAVVDREHVNQSIAKGVQWLQEQQLIDGTWGIVPAYGGGPPAFGAYVLLKCGLDPETQAIQMAVRAAEELPCTTTYSLSSLILMLCALDDPGRKNALEDAVERLLHMQSDQGSYAYPVHPENGETHEDLSNTLFAALALRAARSQGIEIPASVWKDLAEGTLRYQEPRGDTKATLNGVPILGFGYTVGSGATGSMTSAGVSILAICEQESSGGMAPALREKMAKARESGLAWVQTNLQWFDNPRSSGHHYFWIYGLERLGALLGLEKLGKWNWYEHGAQYLVQGQGATGAWYSARGNTTEVDTMLALLFLKRASAPSSGSNPAAAAPAVVDQNAAVGLQVRGQRNATLWLTHVRSDLLTKWVDSADGKLQVEKAEFFGRLLGAPMKLGAAEAPALLASLPAARLKPSELTRLAARHAFSVNGEWELSARLTLREPGAADGAEPIVLESAIVKCSIADVLPTERLAYATHTARNLMPQALPVASASSVSSDTRAADKSVDGSAATEWLCRVDDENPRLTLRLKQSVKASRILLSPSQPRLAHRAAPRPARVSLKINGKPAATLELSADPLQKCEFVLEKPVLVRELEWTVEAVHGGELGKAELGFSEVELLED